MKPIEVENVGVMNIFVKSFLGQLKIQKTPFSAINGILYLINFFFFVTMKSRDSEVFKYICIYV